MANRYSVDLDDADEEVFEKIYAQNDKTKVETWRQLLREGAERRGIADVDDSDEDTEITERIQYHPDEHGERYTLDLDELHTVLDDYDTPAIDPSHLGDLPKRVKKKGELVAAYYRYRCDPGAPVTSGEVTKCVRGSIGAGSQDRLLQERVNAAKQAFYKKELEDGVIAADNINPVQAEIAWESELFPNRRPTVDDVLGTAKAWAEDPPDADNLDEAVNSQIERMEFLMDVAEEYGEDDVYEDAANTKQGLEALLED